MSAPASTASAAPAPMSKAGDDRVLSIVDDMNSTFTRWLSLRHKRKRAITAELALEADVTGLSESDRARLRHLLACHGFDVVAVIPTSSDGRESIALFRGAAPVAAAEQNDEKGKAGAEGAKEEDGEEEEKHTECGNCKALATPDFIKLPDCGHIFCPKCTLYLTTSPDCRCCEVCLKCSTRFFFEDMEYLDGSSHETNPPPSKRQKTTDAGKATSE